ncbi:unnamed protein product, partial [marine sediment metagenome]
RIQSSSMMSAGRIGIVDDTKVVKLSMNEETRNMFDFTKGPVLTPRTGHD